MQRRLAKVCTAFYLNMIDNVPSMMYYSVTECAINMQKMRPPLLHFKRDVSIMYWNSNAKEMFNPVVLPNPQVTHQAEGNRTTLVSPWQSGAGPNTSLLEKHSKSVN
jgi:hypothetical protein